MPAAAIDQDTQTVIDALNAAQQTSGLDQASFARALGTSPSRYSTYRTGTTAPSAAFLMRAVRIGAALAEARRAGVPSSLGAADSIRAALRPTDPPDDDGEADLWAFTLVLEARDRVVDTITHHPGLVGCWDAVASTGDARWDALLAAVVGQAFTAAGLPAPRWTTVERRLDIAWMPVDSLRFSPEQVRDHTPTWLADRNIFVADTDLTTL
jgi:transcriptional regulator with XRE-family HTH domain